MTPAEAAARRGVSEIVHFTTEKGLLGSIRKDSLLSRRRVQDDPDLAFILQRVWPRRDHSWIDYISLSVNTINLDLYRAAQNHLPDLWWTVLAFDPAILDHDDVWFATTNNIYPSCRRAQSLVGFEALYADEVRGRYSERRVRDGLDGAQPTDRAAEVLYPRELALDHLVAVYVPSDEHRQHVLAWCDALGRAEPRVEVRQDVFA